MPLGPKLGFELVARIEDQICDIILGIPKEKWLETEGMGLELYHGIPKRDPKGLISMGRVETIGWLVVGTRIFGTPTIAIEGVEGIPLIT